MSMSHAAKISALLLAAMFAMSCSGVYRNSEDVHYTEVDSGAQKIRLAYRDHGTGKPLVLLHGFGASSYTWRHVEPALVAAGYRVLSVDLKGFGLSDKPLDESYSIFDQAELVSQFLDQLKLTRVTLIGHSLGGGVALVLALNENQDEQVRISRMVLIDSVAYAQNIPIAFNILRTPVLGEIGSRLVPLEVQARVALKLAFFDDTKFDENDVKNYTDPLRDKGSRNAMIQTARKILPDNLPELSGRFKTIRIPSLIVWCDHDKVIKPNIGLRLHHDIPNSIFRLVRNCGHLPQEERPKETVRLLKDFLRK